MMKEKKIKRKEKGEQRLLTCKTNRLCAYLFLSAWLISRREFNGNARNVNVCPPSLIIIPSFAYIFPFKFQSSTSTRSIFSFFLFFFSLFTNRIIISSPKSHHYSFNSFNLLQFQSFIIWNNCLKISRVYSPFYPIAANNIRELVFNNF